jgi:iron(III) transport system substrate-binding protein
MPTATEVTNAMRLPTTSLPLLAAMLLSACTAATPSPTPSSTPGTPTASPSAGGSITVYSGRSEELVAPLIEQFETATGINVEVRYGDTAELAVLLTEESTHTPADVYFAQDAGALGAVAQADMLAPLPAEILARVPEALRSPDGEWVGVSGRARVVAYDSRELAEADLPQSIDELTDPAWRGRIGWAPTNGSFQAFVTVFRLMRGEDAARAWLEGIVANEPVTYEGNTPIVQAIADGEIDVGLVNHYYALRQRAEQGSTFPTLNHYLGADDPGALVNVAGAGVLAASDNAAAAQRFVDYLLGADAQAYFAEETFEYPLVEGVAPPAGAPPLAELATPDIDLSDLSDLQGTLELLTEVGALP